MSGRKRLVWGYIDLNGEFVIRPQFDDAWEFHDGLAAVKIDWARGYIDRSGQIAIPAQFEKAEPFRDGVARVMVDGCWKVIDPQGQEVAAAGAIQESAPRKPEEPYLKIEAGKAGYVDGNGEWVIPPQFHDAGNFFEGRAKVRKSPTSKWGYIDRSGKFAFTSKFEGAEDFHDGLAAVLVKVDEHDGF